LAEDSKSQPRKQSGKLPKDSKKVEGLDENMTEPKESAKTTGKQSKDNNERGEIDSKAQQLNFYQNSEGSSDNLEQKSVDQDNNDSGEIIYQQNKAGNAEKEMEQPPAKNRSYAINDQQQH
jgi:hypothetical protein